MNLLNRLISNLRARQFSSTKLRERYLIKDFKYLKKAFLQAPRYLKIQAVEYLSDFSDQGNLDFLLKEYKKQKDIKLKSYTFQSIIIIAENEELELSDSDELLLTNNFNLLDNIGYAKNSKVQRTKSTPIAFRTKLKDHLLDLEHKKKMNDVGF